MIVKFEQYVNHPAAHSRLSIPALVADEAHIYLRSSNSGRVQSFAKLIPQTHIKIQLSGTFFSVKGLVLSLAATSRPARRAESYVATGNLADDEATP